MAIQVTALMGVHTLGKADIHNSGFHGTWVNNEQVDSKPEIRLVNKYIEIFQHFRAILTTSTTQAWSTQVLTGVLPGMFTNDLC